VSYKVVTSPTFEKQAEQLARKYHSLKADLEVLISQLEENPKMGSPLGRNCYKVRLAIKSKGRGKSTGGRIITHVHVIKELVRLLMIYDKSEKGSLTDDEFEKLTAGLP